MKKFISCFAASLLFSVSSFAFADQTSNFLLRQQRSDFASSPKVLQSSIIDNKVNPIIVGNRITIVNNSNRLACITVVSGNPLRSSGWYILQNRAIQTVSGISYIRAEECGTEGGVYWDPGWDMQYFCLKYGPAFNFYEPGNSSMCANLGGQMKLHYRVPGDVTLSLD